MKVKDLESFLKTIFDTDIEVVLRGTDHIFRPVTNADLEFANLEKNELVESGSDQHGDTVVIVFS